jgi:hypothetical protein
MTLGNDASFFVKCWYLIRAVPCTVLTAYTARVIMPDDTVVQLDVRLRRTALKTFRFYTVVTAHRIKELKGIWKFSHLHLSYTSPFDVIGVGILFVTCYFTAMTAYTGSGIEMKTVLLSCFKFRQVYAVVTTLHPSVGFMVDEV